MVARGWVATYFKATIFGLVNMKLLIINSFPEMHIDATIQSLTKILTLYLDVSWITVNYLMLSISTV